MSIQIQKVTDKSFRKYGRILTGEYDVAIFQSLYRMGYK